MYELYELYKALKEFWGRVQETDWVFWIVYLPITFLSFWLFSKLTKKIGHPKTKWQQLIRVLWVMPIGLIWLSVLTYQLDTFNMLGTDIGFGIMVINTLMATIGMIVLTHREK